MWVSRGVEGHGFSLHSDHTPRRQEFRNIGATAEKSCESQPVDATPSNQLIGQCFTLESRSVWLDSIRPIQDSGLFESTLASAFSFSYGCADTSSECSVH